MGPDSGSSGPGCQKEKRTPGVLSVRFRSGNPCPGLFVRLTLEVERFRSRHLRPPFDICTTSGKPDEPQYMAKPIVCQYQMLWGPVDWEGKAVDRKIAAAHAAETQLDRQISTGNRAVECPWKGPIFPAGGRATRFFSSLARRLAQARRLLRLRAPEPAPPGGWFQRG
jgi:hypothetical protein